MRGVPRVEAEQHFEPLVVEGNKVTLGQRSSTSGNRSVTSGQSCQALTQQPSAIRTLLRSSNSTRTPNEAASLPA